jgi:hypothetical protein
LDEHQLIQENRRGALNKYDMFFQQQRNVARELGHITEQKVTAALRMLAYGIPVDDHLAMGESQVIKCVKRFAVAMVKVFGEVYLRAPNEAHTSRLLEFNLFQQRVELGIRRSI